MDRTDKPQYRHERLKPEEVDNFRKERFGVDGTKIFVQRVTGNAFLLKAQGKTHVASSFSDLMGKIDAILSERFEIKTGE